VGLYRYPKFYHAAIRLALKFIPAKRGIVFLTLHHIDSSEVEWLCEVLDDLKRSYDFIDVKDIEEVVRLPIRDSRPKLVLTFDDAFACQKMVADECLSSRNIKALFFVPTAFVALEGQGALNFTKASFYPKSQPKQLPMGAYDAMRWADIRALVAEGHSIGAHTASHPILSNLSEEDLRDEIINSADFLESELKVKIRHFAYPFGSVEATSQLSHSIVKKRFDWAFSNIRGVFKDSPSKHFIYRQNLVPKTPLWLVKAIVEGRLDFIYRKKHTLAKRLFHSN
jgi:peptidoglycan/xylan/chitin deacetylase (PgdA/CDA1 family)